MRSPSQSDQDPQEKKKLLSVACLPRCGVVPLRVAKTRPVYGPRTQEPVVSFVITQRSRICVRPAQESALYKATRGNQTTAPTARAERRFIRADESTRVRTVMEKKKNYFHHRHWRPPGPSTATKANRIRPYGPNSACGVAPR